MKDRRRITFTTGELAAIQHALATRIDACMFRITTARTREARNFHATECTHAIAGYRKAYAYPSGKSLTTQIANKYSERLGNALIAWDEVHHAK